MIDIIIIIVWATCFLFALTISLFGANEFTKHPTKIKVQIVIVVLIVWAVCYSVGYTHNIYWCDSVRKEASDKGLKRLRD